MEYFIYKLKGHENLMGLSLTFNVNVFEIKILNKLSTDNISFLKEIKLPIRCKEKLKNIENEDNKNEKEKSELIDKINIIKNRLNLNDNDFILDALKENDYNIDKSIIFLNNNKSNIVDSIMVNNNKGKIKIE